MNNLGKGYLQEQHQTAGQMQATQTHGVAKAAVLTPPFEPVLGQRIAEVVANFHAAGRLTNQLLSMERVRGRSLRSHFQPSDLVELSRQDDGPGIAAAYIDQVFEQFFRIAPGYDGGRGLCLAVVAIFAAAHGSRASRSSAKHGACFPVHPPIQ